MSVREEFGLTIDTPEQALTHIMARFGEITCEVDKRDDTAYDKSPDISPALEIPTFCRHDAIPAARSPRPLREALIEHPAYPQVRVANTYARLREIGRLRHRQYVMAQGKPYASAVRDPATLLELADFTSVNLYAVDTYGLTAAMRIGPLLGSGHPRAAYFCEVAAELDVDPSRTLTCTRLVRDPRHSGRHAVDLVSFVRLQTVQSGWRWCLMQTSAALERFFERQNFVSTGRWIEDECAGRLQTMLLDTNDDPIRRRPAFVPEALTA